MRAQNIARGHIGALLLQISTLLTLPSAPIFAQAVSPSQVTPRTLRLPAPNPEQLLLVRPETPRPVQEATEEMSVQVGHVTVQNGFPALAQDTEALLRPYIDHRITPDEVAKLAVAIEQAYASRGFVLARVVVPPQQVTDGDVLYLRVIDGFVQEVDVQQVPVPMRDVVRRRVSPLIGRHRIRLRTLERQVLLAGDVSGLRLHSTLAPGTEEGGTILVLTGTYQKINGSLSADNRLDRALGPWEVNVDVAVNSFLGQGEEFYGYGSSADPQHIGRARTPLQVYGGGVVVPLGGAGITLSFEYTHSVTRTEAEQQVPATNGLFERETLRSTWPVRWTREGVTKIIATAEEISQELKAPQFGLDLTKDQYRVLRVGFDNEALAADGRRLAFDVTVSKGLGGRNGADATPPSVPLSRLGASPQFTKLTASAHYTQSLSPQVRFALTLVAQDAFGQAQLRSEQFSLDGVEELSPFAPGTLTVDQGATLRSELTRAVLINTLPMTATLAPYLMGAVGLGVDFKPTSLENRSVTATAFGAGLRAAFGGLDDADFAFELAHQHSSEFELRDEWRGTVSLSVRF